jgi:hypothetical protein
MRRLLLIFAVVLFPAAPLAQTKIKVGTVRSTVIGGVVSAQAVGTSRTPVSTSISR